MKIRDNRNYSLILLENQLKQFKHSLVKGKRRLNNPKYWAKWERGYAKQEKPRLANTLQEIKEIITNLNTSIKILKKTK